MIIRLANTQDIPAISRVVSQLDFEKMKASDPEHIRKELDKYKTYVAVSDDNIVGVMVLQFGEESGEIMTLATTQKGTGRKLIQFAIEECQRENTPKLWCWSLSRYNARGFYEKMGFEEAHLLKKQWFGEDCWIFGKVL